MIRKPMEGTIEREIYDLCNPEPPRLTMPFGRFLWGAAVLVASTFGTLFFVKWSRGEW